MSKKKKKKGDEWNIFITRMLNRKRSARRFVIPTDYLWALADKIHRINPTKEIVYNTLLEVFGVASDNAYQKCLNDVKFRRDKQNARIKQDFNKFKDELEDLIHNKPNQKV